MLTDPQLDPMGSLILELRADSDLAALVSTRVRGFEPAAGDAEWSTDLKGNRVFAHAYIVLANGGFPPAPRVPTASGVILATCYGTTPQNAWAVWAALVKALHMVGPRVKSNGLGIYQTQILEGGAQDKDPDTQQPCVRGTISLIATTQAVTA